MSESRSRGVVGPLVEHSTSSGVGVKRLALQNGKQGGSEAIVCPQQNGSSCPVLQEGTESESLGCADSAEMENVLSGSGHSGQKESRCRPPGEVLSPCAESRAVWASCLVGAPSAVIGSRESFPSSGQAKLSGVGKESAAGVCAASSPPNLLSFQIAPEGNKISGIAEKMDDGEQTADFCPLAPVDSQKSVASQCMSERTEKEGVKQRSQRSFSPFGLSTIFEGDETAQEESPEKRFGDTAAACDSINVLQESGGGGEERDVFPAPQVKLKENEKAEFLSRLIGQ